VISNIYLSERHSVTRFDKEIIELTRFRNEMKKTLRQRTCIKFPKIFDLYCLISKISNTYVYCMSFHCKIILDATDNDRI
jgi:hypothetical protein